jgi:plasmid stabilization system protein ParE
MPPVRWTPEALRDVQRLYRFLAPKNRVAAHRAIQAIRTQVQVLAQHPAVGRLVEEMDPTYREWRVAFGDSGYLVLYYYDGSVTVIVAVRHQREGGYF